MTKQCLSHCALESPQVDHLDHSARSYFLHNCRLKGLLNFSHFIKMTASSSVCHIFLTQSQAPQSPKLCQTMCLCGLSLHSHSSLCSLSAFNATSTQRLGEQPDSRCQNLFQLPVVDKITPNITWKKQRTSLPHNFCCSGILVHLIWRFCSWSLRSLWLSYLLGMQLPQEFSGLDSASGSIT